MSPLTIIDYIVVHELAHLIHANHTEAFWNEVDKVLPDYLERKLWLRVNGAGMSVQSVKPTMNKGLSNDTMCSMGANCWGLSGTCTRFR